MEAYFGLRNLPALTPSNRPFHLLEHPETKALCSYILSFHHVDSLIWLHDGIWISPPPANELIHAANLHATARIGLGESPLLLRTRSCVDNTIKPFISFEWAASPLMISLPLRPPLPPRPARPLSEIDARRAFTRMMQSSIPLARPCFSRTKVIEVDD